MGKENMGKPCTGLFYGSLGTHELHNGESGGECLAGDTNCNPAMPSIDQDMKGKQPMLTC